MPDAEDEDACITKPIPVWTRQYHALVAVMKQWRNNGVDGTSVKVLAEYPQLAYSPQHHMTMLRRLEHGDLLLNMLRSTAIHWAAFSPSQVTAHIKMIAGYFINSLWVYVHHGRRYLATNEVWDLRQELVDYLVKDLEDFHGLWDGLAEQVGGRKHAMTQTAGSVPRKLVLENVGKKMEGKTQEVIKHIAQQLVQRDLGAIPLAEGGLGLSKRVYQAAQVLFKVRRFCIPVSILLMGWVGNCGGVLESTDYVYRSEDR